MSRLEAVALAELVRVDSGATSVRVHKRNPVDGVWQFMVSAVDLSGGVRRYWASAEEYRLHPAGSFKERQA